MDRFEVLDLSQANKWNNYFRQLPVEQQDIYYTPEYYQLYEDNGDGKAQCFVFEKKGAIALYPSLINPVNTLGYELDKPYFDIQGAYGYNGVVAGTYDDDFVRSFYNAFDNYCDNQNIIAEFTRFNPLLNNHKFSGKYMSVFNDRKTVYVDLETEYEVIVKNYQRTTRKQIRRCRDRYNISVKFFENNPDILNVFRPVYIETMDRVKSDPYLYFSEEYLKGILKNTTNVCVVAYIDNLPIASIIAFYNKTYIQGHIGGALTQYLHFSPYSLLYDELIQFGKRKGCKYFHFGGGITNAPDDALLDYKLNFSNLTGDFYIGKKIHNPGIYNEVLKQWIDNGHVKNELYNNRILKYRY